MGSLTALFGLRVFAQAVQRWLPQPWLPPFAAWQGSATPYPLLLAAQLLILGAMVRASAAALKGAMSPGDRATRWAARLGAIYMAAAVARIGIGLGVDAAPAWFSAWISGAFHVVLAAFVLALSRYGSLRHPSLGRRVR